MFLESVGWVELTQNTTSLPGTNIDMLFDALPSTTVVTDYIPRNNIYGWSDNAGWIDFNSTNISSGITYIG